MSALLTWQCAACKQALECAKLWRSQCRLWLVDATSKPAPILDRRSLIHFAGMNLADAMERAQVLDFELQKQLVPLMRDMVPLPGERSGGGLQQEGRAQAATHSP